MIVEEKFRVKAPIQKVWQFLLDPERIGSCIPGCQQIEVLGENEYETTITIKLPIDSITAKSKTTVTEINPPHHLKSVTEGQSDIGFGTFYLETVIDLEETSEKEVEISYSADTKLEGGLVGFGEKIMNAMAKQLAERFAKNIQERLEAEAGGICCGRD